MHFFFKKKYSYLLFESLVNKSKNYNIAFSSETSFFLSFEISFNFRINKMVLIFIEIVNSSF